MVIGGLVTERLGSKGSAARADALDARAAEFERLVERRLDEAYRLATFILRDPSEAEDVVHDAALAAWRHRSELRDPARADAWFQRILVNSCRDRLRAKGRRRVATVGLDLSRVDGARSPDVADRVVAGRTIDDAVVRLEPDDQVLVALRYGLDLTVPAIATALGIRQGTVKSRLHRVLGRLRDRPGTLEAPRLGARLVAGGRAAGCADGLSAARGRLHPDHRPVAPGGRR